MPAAAPLPTATGDWFSFRDLGEGITLVNEPHVIPLLRCNIWHICGRGLDLMVDTGLGVSSLHAASRHLFGQRIAALATHVHLDHVGGHHEFAECWCHSLKADALTRADPDGTLAGFDLSEVNIAVPGYDTGGPALTALPTSDYDLSAWEIQQTTVTRRIDEGDAIDLGNHHFRGAAPARPLAWQHRPVGSEERHAVLRRPIYDGSLIDDLHHSDWSVCRHCP